MEITTLLVATLPWLLILACPLVMWWMMRGMGCDQRPSPDGAGKQTGAGTEDEIRLLKERIADLEGATRSAGASR